MTMDNVPQTPQDDKKGLGLGGIATIGGLGLLVLFMAQNTEDVTVKFITWEFTWPLYLVILVSAVVGSIIWIGLGILRRHRRRKARREARRD